MGDTQSTEQGGGPSHSLPSPQPATGKYASMAEGAVSSWSLDSKNMSNPRPPDSLPQSHAVGTTRPSCSTVDSSPSPSSSSSCHPLSSASTLSADALLVQSDTDAALIAQLRAAKLQRKKALQPLTQPPSVPPESITTITTNATNATTASLAQGGEIVASRHPAAPPMPVALFPDANEHRPFTLTDSASGSSSSSSSFLSSSMSSSSPVTLLPDPTTASDTMTSDADGIVKRDKFKKEYMPEPIIGSGQAFEEDVWAELIEYALPFVPENLSLLWDPNQVAMLIRALPVDPAFLRQLRQRAVEIKAAKFQKVIEAEAKARGVVTPLTRKRQSGDCSDYASGTESSAIVQSDGGAPSPPSTSSTQFGDMTPPLRPSGLPSYTPALTAAMFVSYPPSLASLLLDACPGLEELRFKQVPRFLSEDAFWQEVFLAAVTRVLYFVSHGYAEEQEQ